MKKGAIILSMALAIGIILSASPAHAQASSVTSYQAKSGPVLTFSFLDDLFKWLKIDVKTKTPPPKNEKDLKNWWNCFDWTSWWSAWCKSHHWKDCDDSYEIWKKYYCG